MSAQARLAVKLTGVKKTYRLGKTDVTALAGVDLELEQGELCALMGQSGSGKTTLLNILGCLDVPTSGTYQLGDRLIASTDFNDLAFIRGSEIGFIFQSFNLIPVLDVAENVELSMLPCKRWSKGERRARAAALIEAVGLGAFARHRPDELSGGQRQRVAIARALAPAPRLILADEPTASLDSQTGSTIGKLLVEMNRDLGATIVFSTHDSQFVGYARRRIRLQDGLIVEDTRQAAAALP